LSLGYFQETNKPDQIGKGLINVAYFAYLLGDFKKSARALTAALKMLKPIDYYYSSRSKNMSKHYLN
jgi:hypothetical protein